MITTTSEPLSMTPHPAAREGMAGRAKPEAVLVVRELHARLVYPEAERRRARRLARLMNGEGAPTAEMWARAEVAIAGWGMPVLTEEFLHEAPELKAVFYAAGSVRAFMTDAAWERGVVVTTAAAANSSTTAEFCVGEILFSLKHGWRFARDPRRSWRTAYDHQEIPGLYGSRVGLVSFGRVARRVAELLRAFSLEVVAWDPTQSDETFAEWGVKRCGLDELIATSDVVSLHLPQLPETEGIINAGRLASLKPGATLINTSRGEVLDEGALTELLARRPDLTAVLDVTYPEPPHKDSPLFELPNVVMTPHLAGCYGPECRRLGAMALDELERYVSGMPLRHALTQAEAALMA